MVTPICPVVTTVTTVKILSVVWQILATTTKHDPPVRHTLPPGDLGPVRDCQ